METISEDKRMERIAYQKEYNKKNKEKVANYQKMYYQRRKAELREKQRMKISNMNDEEKQSILARNRIYAERWRDKLSDDEKLHRRELQRIYRENNKEKIKSYRDKANKLKQIAKTTEDRVKLKDPNYIQCKCGKVVHKTNMRRHEQTKTHIQYTESAKTISCEIIETIISKIEKC